MGEVKVAGIMTVPYVPFPCPCLVSFYLSLTAPRMIGFITFFKILIKKLVQ